jgi:hypothetical protein
MKRPIEIIKEAQGTKFEDEDGGVEELKLLPPLSSEEIKKLQSSIPCPIPDEVMELLLYCRGFDGALESIDFSGLEGGFGLDEIFPYAISIAHDGCGNFWVVDLTKDSKSWGPIFFACHDAPVIVFQTSSLSHFISEVIRLGNPPWKSEIDDVHEKYHKRVWRENPGTLTYAQCFESGDQELTEFAVSLGESFLFIDMRNAKVGDGFSWGRYGPQTINKRFKDKRIFAYEVRKSFWQRLFGDKRLR